MTGLLARLSGWLVRREPLWLVTGAGAVLDVVTYVVPVVPPAWHPYVNAAVVLLGVISGRSLVTPTKAAQQPADVPPPAADPRPPSGGNVTVVKPSTATTPSGVTTTTPPPVTPHAQPGVTVQYNQPPSTTG